LSITIIFQANIHKVYLIIVFKFI